MGILPRIHRPLSHSRENIEKNKVLPSITPVERSKKINNILSIAYKWQSYLANYLNSSQKETQHGALINWNRLCCLPSDKIMVLITLHVFIHAYTLTGSILTFSGGKSLEGPSFGIERCFACSMRMEFHHQHASYVSVQ